MFKSIILLLSLALCHQAISVGPSEPSGHHELRANDVFSKHITNFLLENLNAIYDLPRVAQDEKEDRLAMFCNRVIMADQMEMDMRKLPIIARPVDIVSAVAAFDSIEISSLHLPHGISDPDGKETLMKQGEDFVAANIRMLLRLLLNTYKFHDLKHPDSPLSDATRKQLLFELKAGTQKLQGYAIEDDGLGCKGFTALVDDWTSVIEPIETLLREEKVKLGLSESCTDARVASLLWPKYPVASYDYASEAPDNSDVAPSVMIETNRKIMEELERVFGDITVNHYSCLLSPLSWPEDVLHRLRRIPELPGFETAIHSDRCTLLVPMHELAPFISQRSLGTGPSVPSTAVSRRRDIGEPSSRVLRSNRNDAGASSSHISNSGRSTGGRRGRSQRD
ncbi:hypothetical protein SeLEV6574_g07010 [Synchytrium endobioticum]|uniref:Uncharacterized protein n=1 Tax=Synchytrium endobioticum TaxID=286115 RepID=A0A507CF74_9FUNG|nr:hypothetical protein SeLEV6574_g07010 [Synchytrium endobioticum]